MNNKNNKKRVGSEAQYGPRIAGEILRDYLEKSDDPLAVAYRKHLAEVGNEGDTDLDDELFRSLHPNTELDVDLKLLTRRPGRLAEGERLHGVIERDGEEHFTFVENAAEREIAHSSTEQPLATDSPRLESMPQTVRRYPKVYEGRTINVIRMDDGTLRLTFRRPRFTRDFTFQDFCLAAANELEQVAYWLDEGEGALSV